MGRRMATMLCAVPANERRIQTMDMQRIEAAAQTVQLPQIPKTSSRNSRLSFNIVNSDSNGKRVKLSKGLTTALGITESADILPIKGEGLIMVAEKLPYEAACSVSLKDEGRNGTSGAKIAYNSGMVALLTMEFDLDFSEHVSMSFSDISIEKLEDGTTVALIRISNVQPEDTPSTEEQ